MGSMITSIGDLEHKIKTRIKEIYPQVSWQQIDLGKIEFQFSGNVLEAFSKNYDQAKVPFIKQPSSQVMDLEVEGPGSVLANTIIEEINALTNTKVIITTTSLHTELERIANLKYEEIKKSRQYSE